MAINPCAIAGFEAKNMNHDLPTKPSPEAFRHFKAEMLKLPCPCLACQGAPPIGGF